MPDIGAVKSNPAGAVPMRRRNSIRRSSTISTTWPDGAGNPMLMIGQARDLVTGAEGTEAVVQAEGSFTILASPRREILSISSTPEIPALQKLVGQRAGGNLRMLLASTVPREKAAGTPLYLILDDFSGASLVAHWAWSRWMADYAEAERETGARAAKGKRGTMEGVCIGFKPGSSALNPDGSNNESLQGSTPVPSMVNPADPLGWHSIVEQTGVGMRRARWIDVWVEDGKIQMDLGFQDSATDPQCGRVAVHEYLATATADLESFELLSLTVDPRILPYQECFGAVPLAQRVRGTFLHELRLKVLQILPGTLGCTHLNDVLRSVAEVPQMVRALRG